MALFLYRLHPPRPDFTATMSPAEASAMGAHVGYWSDKLAQGEVLVFSPVPDPAGDWGLAVVLAPDAETVGRYGQQDPAVVAGVAEFSVLELPFAVAASVAGV